MPEVGPNSLLNRQSSVEIILPNSANKTAPTASTSTNPQFVMANSKFTPQSLIELACDAYISMWSDIQKYDIDSLVNVTTKLCYKRKGNQKTIDMRMKGLVDTLRTSVCYENPFLYLYGHLNGLLPKRIDSMRNALGVIATTAVILSYSDAFYQNNKFQDQTRAMNSTSGAIQTVLPININETELNGNNIRSKFKKHFAPRMKGFATDATVSLKKCIVIVDYFLNKASNAFWLISSLSASCVEYQCKLPWTIQSIEKLLSFLFEIWERFYLHADHVSAAGHSGNVKAQTDYDSISHQAFQWIPNAVKSFWGSYELHENAAPVSVNELSNLLNQKLKSAEGKVIGVAVFAMACAYAWEAEYIQIKSILERRTIAISRREGMTSYYDAKSAAEHTSHLTVGERVVMNKIVDYFSAIGAKGVDWAALKTVEGRESVPFAIPDSLVARGYLELDHLARTFAASKKRNLFHKHVDAMQDDFLTYPVTESLNSFQELGQYNPHWGTSGESVSISSRNEDVLSIAKSKYLSSANLNVQHLSPINRSQFAIKEEVEGDTTAPSSSGGLEEYDDLGLATPAQNNKGGRLSVSAPATQGLKLLYSPDGSPPKSARVIKQLPPTLDDYMYTDKYLKQSMILSSSVPNLNCFGGDLTYIGLRRDHLSPGRPMSSKLMQSPLDLSLNEDEFINRNAISAKFKPVPNAYEAPRPGKTKVAMIDAMSVKPGLLEKVKLVQPLEGALLTDEEKFEFLPKGAEFEQRQGGLLLGSLGLENMLLGKGNTFQSTSASSEFLEFITNPEKSVTRIKDSAPGYETVKGIYDVVNHANQTGIYLGVPTSVALEVSKSRARSRAQTEADELEAWGKELSPVRSHRNSVAGSEVLRSPATSQLETNSFDEEDEDDFNVVYECRTTNSAIPTRNPTTILSRLISPLGRQSVPVSDNIASSSILDSEEEEEYEQTTSSVLFRMLEPAGIMDRRILNLSHINDLREEEYPVLDLECFVTPVDIEASTSSTSSAVSVSRSVKDIAASREMDKQLRHKEKLLAAAPKLKSVIVRNAKVGNDTFQKIVDRYLCAPYVNNLKLIDLTGNCIGTVGIQMLATSFEKNGCAKLKSLILSGNLFKNSGLKMILANGTSKNGFRDLMKLDIRNCGITMNSPAENSAFVGLGALSNLR